MTEDYLGSTEQRRQYAQTHVRIIRHNMNSKSIAEENQCALFALLHIDMERGDKKDANFTDLSGALSSQDYSNHSASYLSRPTCL